MTNSNANPSNAHPNNSADNDPLLGTNSHSPVVGTYSIVDWEVGVRGGGPLFADGTFGGNLTVNFSLFGFDKGELIFQLQPTTWTYEDYIPLFDGPGIVVNYNVKAIKGTPPVLGNPPGTFTDVAPITGTPERIDIPPLSTVGHPDLLIRVTPNPNFENYFGS